jgi:hypothetical protein
VVANAEKVAEVVVKVKEVVANAVANAEEAANAEKVAEVANAAEVADAAEVAVKYIYNENFILIHYI